MPSLGIMTAAVPVPGSPEWLRPLGTTGLTVSAIGAGGGPLGGMPDARQAIGLVRHLLDSPIRVIDTSNGYSDGASEKRIGAGIAQHGGLPDGYLIATKVDARGGDYSGARIRDSIHESQDRLGLETFPLVHLHDPEYHPEAGFDLPGARSRRWSPCATRASSSTSASARGTPRPSSACSTWASSRSSSPTRASRSSTGEPTPSCSARTRRGSAS
ncbi:hypothetical protein GCM10025881_16730 [Pseudolysinimonas kribbensis]|uniref:NADP-dependent oxidoreductase domain-containing protein n=1 Tax=Pseudolysinimonas kribbensis TaxID=433641 RepID=A0ABQ6K6E1_9MICO|nr:hypothetical protein GCM10025881_16730 [Pseudolysinimonas kribbensis]